MADSVPLAESLAHSIKQLTEASKLTADASLALSRPVATINNQLRAMNLGVTAWERIHGDDNDGYGNFWSHDIGFTQHGHTWGLMLRTSRGNHAAEEHASLTEWTFDEAPAHLRIDAVDKIPALIDKLIKVAVKTSKKLREKANDAQLIANTVENTIQEVKQAARDERQRQLRERQS